MKRVNLKTTPEINRTINRIANALLNNEISPQKANALILACNTALNAIKVGKQVGDEIVDNELHIVIDYGNRCDEK